MKLATFLKLIFILNGVFFLFWWILSPWLLTLTIRGMHLRPYDVNRKHMEAYKNDQNHMETHSPINLNLMRSRDGSHNRSNRTALAVDTRQSRHPIQHTMGDLYKIVIMRCGKLCQHEEYPKLCDCQGGHFYLTNDTAVVREADVVVFPVGNIQAMTADERTQRHKERGPSQLWILVTLESPQTCLPVIPPEDMVKAYNLSFTYHSRSNFPTPYGRFIKFGSPRNVSGNWYAEKSKLIQWTSSHCDLGKRRYRRTKFVYALKDYLNISMYGECGDGKVYGDDYVEEVRGHKFALVMENSCCSEYITEKLWNALTIYYNVPVVYGATREEYERIAPPNSFIFIQDFSSLQELADYIIEVGSDEMKYNQYHDWRRLGYAQKQNLYNDRIYHCYSICRLSNTIKEAQKGKIFQFDQNSDMFYGGCRKCQDEVDILLSGSAKSKA